MKCQTADCKECVNQSAVDLVFVDRLLRHAHSSDLWDSMKLSLQQSDLRLAAPANAMFHRAPSISDHF